MGRNSRKLPIIPSCGYFNWFSWPSMGQVFGKRSRKGKHVEFPKPASLRSQPTRKMNNHSPKKKALPPSKIEGIKNQYHLKLERFQAHNHSKGSKTQNRLPEEWPQVHFCKCLDQQRAKTKVIGNGPPNRENTVELHKYLQRTISSCFNTL